MTASVMGRNRRVCLVYFLPVLRATSVDRVPVFDGSRHISHATIGILPAGEHRHLPAFLKKAPKQRDSLSGALVPVYRCCRHVCFGWKRIPWKGLWKHNAVRRQYTVQASIFFP